MDDSTLGGNPPTELYKECPWCAEKILAKAIVCRYCGRDLPSRAQPSGPADVPAPIDGIATGGNLRSDDSTSTQPSAKVASPGGTPERAIASPSSKPAGIRNWLALFALGQVFVVAISFTALWSDIITLTTLSARGLFVDSGLTATVSIYDLCGALRAVTSLLLLVLMFRRNPLTPRVALFVLPASALLYLAQAGAASDIIAKLPAGTGPPAGLPTAQSAMQVIIYSLIWILYWRRSAQVRELFGSNGERMSSTNATARRGVRKTAAFAVVAASTCAALAFFTGASQARAIVAAVQAPANSADEKFNADAVVAKFMRDQGGNVDSFFQVHPASDTAFLKKYSAAAAVTSLTDAERRELVQLRAMMMERLDPQRCARFVQTGAGLDENVLSSAETRRIDELAGISVGRRISGKFPGRETKIADSRVRSILVAHANPEELAQVNSLAQSGATATQRCEAGKTVYRIILNIPPNSPDSQDGLYWLLDSVSGRSPQ